MSASCRHVTRVNESCHTYECVMTHISMMHVTHHTCYIQRGVSHKRMCHGTHTMRVDMACATSRPTQSIMYVPQENRYQKNVLLILQYRYLNSCSGDFYSPESDPPHKIMRYWFYYSIWLVFSFPPDHAGHLELFCTTVVPVSKGHLGGASP